MKSLVLLVDDSQERLLQQMACMAMHSGIQARAACQAEEARPGLLVVAVRKLGHDIIPLLATSGPRFLHLLWYITATILLLAAYAVKAMIGCCISKRTIILLIRCSPATIKYMREHFDCECTSSSELPPHEVVAGPLLLEAYELGSRLDGGAALALAAVMLDGFLPAVLGTLLGFDFAWGVSTLRVSGRLSSSLERGLLGARNGLQLGVALGPGFPSSLVGTGFRLCLEVGVQLARLEFEGVTLAGIAR